MSLVCSPVVSKVVGISHLFDWRMSLGSHPDVRRLSIEAILAFAYTRYSLDKADGGMDVDESRS